MLTKVKSFVTDHKYEIIAVASSVAILTVSTILLTKLKVELAGIDTGPDNSVEIVNHSDGSFTVKSVEF